MDADSEGLAWLPTMEFVARLNASEARAGKPYLGPLDGLTMLMWHMQQEVLRVSPRDLVKITGT